MACILTPPSPSSLCKPRRFIASNYSLPSCNLNAKEAVNFLPSHKLGNKLSNFPITLKPGFIPRIQRNLNVSSSSTITVGETEWIQKTFSLPSYKRGCHVITRQIYNAVPEIGLIQVGVANLFILHTSASLTINENASSDVPLDMEDALNKIVPEGNHYRHLDEGYDDMPGMDIATHVKASMMGCSLTIPIRAGRFLLGTWQGIWLNEHRNYGGPRTICITIQGKRKRG